MLRPQRPTVMPSLKKNQIAEMGTPPDPLTTGRIIICKDYSLNTNKAYNKLIKGCSRPVTVKPRQNGQFYIEFNTATYDYVRDTIMQNLHLTLNGQTSRHVEHTEFTDKGGLNVQDTFKINSWQAFSSTFVNKMGRCDVTINLYRTKLSALINSQEAYYIAAQIKKLADALNNNPKVAQANNNVKQQLQKEHEKANKKQTLQQNKSCAPQKDIPALPIEHVDHSDTTGEPAHSLGDNRDTIGETTSVPLIGTKKHLSPIRQQNANAIQTNRTSPRDMLPSIGAPDNPTTAMTILAERRPMSQEQITATTFPATRESTPQRQDNHDDQEEDICPSCFQPALDRIIQCSICYHWIHYQCERMTPEQIDRCEAEEYTCRSCCILKDVEGTLGEIDKTASGINACTVTQALPQPIVSTHHAHMTQPLVSMPHYHTKALPQPIISTHHAHMTQPLVTMPQAPYSPLTCAPLPILHRLWVSHIHK